MEAGVSKRSRSKTSTARLVSVTEPLSSICQVVPATGFQCPPAEEDEAGMLLNTGVDFATVVVKAGEGEPVVAGRG